VYTCKIFLSVEQDWKIGVIPAKNLRNRGSNTVEDWIVFFYLDEAMAYMINNSEKSVLPGGRGHRQITQIRPYKK
jgi:hypothetical protein